MRGWIVGALVFGLWARPAQAAVVINEVLADPPAVGGDANGDGVINSLQDEFVELANTGAQPVSLMNWTLADAVQVRHTFTSAIALPAYSLFVIFGGGTPSAALPAIRASTGTLSLNNTGDTVILRDGEGNLIDLITYGGEGGHDASLTRNPDGLGSFVRHDELNGLHFSAGTTVDGRFRLPAGDERQTQDQDPPPASPTAPEPASLILAALGFGLIRRRALGNVVG